MRTSLTENCSFWASITRPGNGFIPNRGQKKVKVGSSLSEELGILFGLPQGSILSPLLLNIYLIDIKARVDHTTVMGYANDTGIFRGETHLSNLVHALQHEAKGISAFMAFNKLITNQSKTELMIFRPHKWTGDPVTIKVGAADITESREMKLLSYTSATTSSGNLISPNWSLP